MMVQKTIFLSYHHPESQPYVLPAPTDQSLHVILVVERGMHVVLVEELSSELKMGPRVIELYLQERASVVWEVSGERVSDGEQSVIVVAEEHASFDKRFFSKSMSVGTTNYVFVLAGNHARVALTGRISLTGASKQKITVEQLHHAPNTVSSVEINAVLDGTSFLDYQGTITVEKEAVHSQAFQTQKNLVISPVAHVISIPNLQVLAHEVECGHGSAVSHLNDDHLFYLQSRGLSYASCRQLIVDGFLTR